MKMVLSDQAKQNVIFIFKTRKKNSYRKVFPEFFIQT